MTSVILDGNPETPRRLQELARHRFIAKMLAEVVIDMMVCRLAGWEEYEFISILHAEMDGLMNKIKKEGKA